MGCDAGCINYGLLPAHADSTKNAVAPVSPTGQSASAPDTAAAPRANPYVGPRSLRYGESIYGRDREARQLCDLLIAERIVLLYSPSGAGKTSLIQAALRPELEKEDFHVLPVIRVGRGASDGCYPCNPYVMSALLSLEQDVPHEQAIPPEELAAMKLGEYLERREAAAADDEGTFLIFDQFEEILTIDPLNREAKMDFFNQVGEALRDLKRWALFSMREDHVAALDPYLRPIPTRLKATFRLDLLNADGARLAVQRPARAQGVEFTEEATTKLVEDLSLVAVQGPMGVPMQKVGLYVEPVQLQVVCYRLWEKLPAHVTEVTPEYVAETGDVDSALADYYAERVAQIAQASGMKERVIREWFDRRLITEHGIRSQVMRGSVHGDDLNEQSVQMLVDVHLIRGEERRGMVWVELAHDRLVKPVRANNAAWAERNLSVLQHQAAVWQSRGRSDALCLRAEALGEALAWTAVHGGEMTETEKEFLEVCQRNQDARQGKNLRRIVSALVAVVTVISVLAGFAIWQTITAKRERKIADEERRKAVIERNAADARSLAAQALQIQGERLDAALLLATEAQKLSDLPGIRGSLLTTAFFNPRLLSFLQGSANSVGAVAFHPDGTQLATGGYDGMIVLWNVAERRPIELIPGLLHDAVRGLAFSGDGKYLAACGKDGTVALRELRVDAPGTVPLPPAFAHKADVWDVAFSKDSRLLASGGSDGKIVVWNVAEGTAATLSPGVESDGSARTVRAVAFHPDGTLLAAGCADGTLLLWSRKGDAWTPVKRTFAIATREAARVTCLAFSPAGKHLAAGRRTGSVDVYDLSAPGEPVPLFAAGAHTDVVSDIAFSPDGSQLISSGFDGTLRLWDAPAMKQRGPPFTGHIGRVLAVAFSGDEHTVASGGSDRRAILWDTAIHVAAPMRAEAGDATFSIAFSADGSCEADGYDNGSVILIKRDAKDGDVESARQIVPPRDGAKFVPIVAFSADNRRIIATTPDGKLLIRDTGDGGAALEIDAVANNERKKISAVSFNKNGSLVAAALSKKGLNAQVQIWKLGAGAATPAARIESAGDGILYAMEFSPDGTRLALGGDGETLTVWSLAGGSAKLVTQCREEHTGSIRSIAFSPDGRTIATASGDTTLILWDAAGGAQVAPPFTGHQAPVVTVAFSPDGSLLASGSDDTTVILWDVGTRQRVGRLNGHTDTVRALAFSPDSKRLFSGSWDHESRLWELDPNELQKICRQRANRNLTRTEWSAYIRDPEYRKTWKSLPTPGEELEVGSRK